MTLANAERVKYDTIWQHAWYRQKCHSFNLWRERRDIFPAEIKTALDIGCGTGRLFGYWNDNGIEAWAIDISPRAIDENIRMRWSDRIVIGPIWEMTWPRIFDAGICADVMEHIPEDRVESTLKKIFECCETTIFKIANFPSEHSGLTLHMTLKPASWWLEQMQRIGGQPERLTYQTGKEEYLIKWR